jgi:heterodisulfide reductase subunit C
MWLVQGGVMGYSLVALSMMILYSLALIYREIFSKVRACSACTGFCCSVARLFRAFNLRLLIQDGFPKEGLPDKAPRGVRRDQI